MEVFLFPKILLLTLLVEYLQEHNENVFLLILAKEFYCFYEIKLRLIGEVLHAKFKPEIGFKKVS